MSQSENMLGWLAWASGVVAGLTVTLLLDYTPVSRRVDDEVDTF